MGGYDQSRLHAGAEQLSSRQGEKQMNSDRLNESLEALFREIKRVQAAKRAAPPPPPPRPPASPGSAPPPPPPGLSALDQRRLLKAFAAGVTAFLGGLALAMYMTY